MNLYLIRHGRQDSELCNVNVPLCDIGKMQAELVGKRLAGYGISALYSSSLIRAVETAQIINQVLQVPYFQEEALEEIDFGQLTGLTDEQIQEQFGDFMKKRNQIAEDLPFPGGECGQDVWNRTMPVIEKIAAGPYDNVAVVTHGGVIRSLLAGLVGGDFSKKLVFSKALENCSITQLRIEKENKRIFIERINDYAHLEADGTLLRRSFKKGI